MTVHEIGIEELMKCLSDPEKSKTCFALTYSAGTDRSFPKANIVPLRKVNAVQLMKYENDPNCAFISMEEE